MKFTNKYLLTLVFLLLLFGARETYACSCVPPSQTTNEDFQKAAAVFTGRVLDVQRKDDSNTVTIKIAVQKYWKGKISKEVKITTAKDSAMCGFNFEVGKDYLVYASETDGKLSTTICSRTAQVRATQN